MSRSKPWSALTVGVLVLVGIPLLARNHVAWTGGARATVPATAPHAASATSGNAAERPFFMRGFAKVDAIWPIGLDGVETRPTITSASAAISMGAEPRQRVLHVEAESAELGRLVGEIRDVRLKPTCLAGTGELRTADGDVIRLALRLKTDPVLAGHAGTYRILGGTGRFQHASGGGAYFTMLDGNEPVETMTFALKGNISY